MSSLSAWAGTRAGNCKTQILTSVVSAYAILPWCPWGAGSLHQEVHVQIRRMMSQKAVAPVG